MAMRGTKHTIVLLLVFPLYLLLLSDCGHGCWVLDTTRRVLYSADCRFHRNAWNCGKNKKPGMERVSQWKWVPWNCTSWACMEPRSFLRALRGMRLGFIGDSLDENFMVSLLCSLNGSDARARNWKRRGAWRGAYIPSDDVTVGYHCAVLLSKFVKVQNLSGFGSGFWMDIDVPADDWVNATHLYYALVFNTGHWWGYDQSPQESPLVFCKQGRLI